MPHSRNLRARITDAEALLWRYLRSRQLCGVKFRRQHPFGPYILDFYADEVRLVVELDGGQHFQPEQLERDAERTRFLVWHGLSVLRFDNVSVLRETDAVLTRIWSTVCRFPSPRPSPRGRGDL
ncbi:MAG: endonuclease domain-containing protein [Myxococcaceae bacterium]|nr:endonuclease domain-containing protein [Myxococcaceae bacterium]